MEPTEPSFIDKTKNFANFSWDIMNYLRKNGADSLVVSKETYETRHEICKSCEMWIKKCVRNADVLYLPRLELYWSLAH